jgi:hypothetical protein
MSYGETQICPALKQRKAGRFVEVIVAESVDSDVIEFLHASAQVAGHAQIFPDPRRFAGLSAYTRLIDL